jgi:hypothetical protein
VNNRDDRPGHAFISHDPEDMRAADWLQQVLEAAGICVWRDAVDLLPGQDRRGEIRKAVSEGALIFIACFSKWSLSRPSSVQNEELLLAIEQLRMRLPDDPWLIPVRFDDCRVPDIEIGGGRTLTSLERADLFGDDAEAAAERVVATAARLLGTGGADAALHRVGSGTARRPVSTSPVEAGTGERMPNHHPEHEGGAGPFAKATAIGTIVLVALTYLLLAYAAHWPPFSQGK